MLITTRYFGPTGTKGSRIKVTFSYGARPVFVSYPYEYSGIDCHIRAIVEAIQKAKWDDGVNIPVEAIVEGTDNGVMAIVVSVKDKHFQSGEREVNKKWSLRQGITSGQANARIATLKL